MLFLGALALEKHVTWPRWLILLGNASYSIYLVHLLVVYRVAGPVLHAMTAHNLGREAIVASALLAAGIAIAAGIGCFVLIERPLLRGCQGMFNRLTGDRERLPLVAQQSLK